MLYVKYVASNIRFYMKGPVRRELTKASYVGGQLSLCLLATQSPSTGSFLELSIKQA